MKPGETEGGLLAVTEAATLPAVSELAPENDIQVEIIRGETTEEQRAALRRFMEWYRVKIVKDVSCKKAPN
jgi:hypothetical protein